MRFALVLGMLAMAAAPLSAATPARKAPARTVAKPAARPAAKTDWTRVVVATPDGGMRMGNPAAAIKLIEYGSRTCPHCAKFDAEGFPLLKAGPIASGKLSYEFRDYPVHGALDLGPILLGRCVPAARFFDVLDRMFRAQGTLLAKVEAVGAKVEGMTKPTPNQLATVFATDLGYVAFMARLGLPDARAKACLAAPAGIDRIVATAKVANDKYAVSGTPTFIINGKKAEGAYDWAALQPQLAAAGL